MHADYVRHRTRGRALRRTVPVLAALAIATLLVFALAGSWDGGERELRRVGAGLALPAGDSGPLDSDDGYVPVDASLSPFSEKPALASLDPALRDALHQAAEAAGAEGIELRVNGGWRSARYQQELLRRAIGTYGSVEIARQYVKPPAQSSHVTGEAVDVGPPAAAGWLSQRGSEFGLCQIYANEPWHFELATAPGGICPAMTSDAAGG